MQCHPLETLELNLSQLGQHPYSRNGFHSTDIYLRGSGPLRSPYVATVPWYQLLGRVQRFAHLHMNILPIHLLVFIRSNNFLSPISRQLRQVPHSNTIGKQLSNNEVTDQPALDLAHARHSDNEPSDQSISEFKLELCDARAKRADGEGSGTCSMHGRLPVPGMHGRLLLFVWCISGCLS